MAEVTIDLNKKFDASRLHLLRSSMFYNPRNPEGGERFYVEYPHGHETVRLFGLWEWSAYRSVDPASFRAWVESHRDWVLSMAGRAKRLVVMINFTPSWLSRSDDQTPMEGIWQVRNAVLPKDWRIWEDMLAEVQKLLAECGFGGPQVYYEIWNEPDGEYWKGTSGEFLAMYEKTSRFLRTLDPKAKIGGCGVNQWDGRFKDGTPITPTLIRHARANNLPLDFVSWHLFGRPLTALADAMTLFKTETKGMRPVPETFLSEWNIVGPLRHTVLAPMAVAEHRLAIYQARYSHQTIAAWQDFQQDDPEDYGLISHDATVKRQYRIHLAMDQMSRESVGVMVLQDGAAKVLVSKRTNGRLAMLVWSADPTGAGSILRIKFTGQVVVESMADVSSGAVIEVAPDRPPVLEFSIPTGSFVVTGITVKPV